MTDSSATYSVRRTILQLNLNFSLRLAILAVVCSLAGCSSIPSWLGGDDGAPPKRADNRVSPGSRDSGEGKPYPNLASVPERPKTSTAAERKAVTERLLADRDNAAYTDDVMRRQTDDDTLPPRQQLQRDIVGSRSGRGPDVTPSAPPPVSSQAAPEPAGSAAPPAAPVVAETIAPPPPPPPAPAPPPSIATAPPPPPPAPPPVAAARVQAAPAPPLPAAAPPAPPPPPPQLTERSQPNAPRPPAEAPQFGPPPSDLAIVQQENRRRTGAPAPPPSTNMAARAAAPVVAPRHGPKLATITFDRGAALDNERMAMLKQVADSARARGAALVVVGHASGAGPASDRVRQQIANFDLSQDRANAVAAALMQLGVPAESIAIAAVGDAERAAAGAGASNQRAEIFLAN
jgi:outer membrane protein OmpA-like peptidoglycan-associated protein/uncharacterized protein YceK